MTWTIKGYQLDRRPAGERNKSGRTKVDPDLEVESRDPLVAVTKLRNVLKTMEPAERREYVHFRLHGPDPTELLDAAERSGPADGEPVSEEDRTPSNGGDNGQQEES